MVNTLSRAGDFVARYGGEEFVVLLPDTNASGARQLAERLRLAISGLAIDQASECPRPVVTVSVGVATVTPDTSQKATTLLASADEALYQAKRSGRDQVSWG